MNIQNCPTNPLRQKIKEVSFALFETVLYLDGHPNCQQALSHYESLREELEELTEQYEEKYGPLTMYGNEGNTWNWISNPWPWESEAN